MQKTKRDDKECSETYLKKIAIEAKELETELKKELENKAIAIAYRVIM